MAIDLGCPKCKKKTLRVKVSLYLDIPLEFHPRLSKGNLRSSKVKVEGAGWPTCKWYCSSCNWVGDLG